MLGGCLQAHPFFEGVDWQHLYSTRAPYQPTVSHELDTRNFEHFEVASPGMPPGPPHPVAPRLQSLVPRAVSSLLVAGNYVARAFQDTHWPVLQTANKRVHTKTAAAVQPEECCLWAGSSSIVGCLQELGLLLRLLWLHAVQEEAPLPSAEDRRRSQGARHTADPHFIGYTYKNWDAVHPSAASHSERLPGLAPPPPGSLPPLPPHPAQLPSVQALRDSECYSLGPC